MPLKYEGVKKKVWMLCARELKEKGHIEPRIIKGIIVDEPFYSPPHYVDLYIELKVAAGFLKYDKENDWYTITNNTMEYDKKQN